MLGTGLVWRRARPQVPDSLEVAARTKLCVYEVFAVRVATGHGQSWYPFTTLLYQSAAFKPFVGIHFADMIVPNNMVDVGTLGDELPLKRQLVLWDARFVCMYPGS